MKYLSLIAGLLCVSVQGCGPPSPPLTPVEIEQQLQEFGQENLPANAKKVMDLGNNWKTFELEIDGVNHKFLFHRNSDYYGDTCWSQESVTEIALEPLP